MIECAKDIFTPYFRAFVQATRSYPYADRIFRAVEKYLFNYHLLDSMEIHDKSGVAFTISRPKSAIALHFDAATQKEIDQLLEEVLRAKNAGVALPSAILQGPPGTGKSTTAALIAKKCGLDLCSLTSRFIEQEPSAKLDLLLESLADHPNPVVVCIEEGAAPYGAQPKRSSFFERLKKHKNVLLVLHTDKPVLDAVERALFDRVITLPLPGLKVRTQILACCARDCGTGALLEKRIAQLAEETDGCSPKELFSVFERHIKNSLP